jgi:hypothetical protein
MKKIKIGPKGTIKLPGSIFKPYDRVIIVSTKDAIMIKKISSPFLSSIPARKKGKSLPLKEIVKEIHSFRKEKKNS